MCGHCDNNIKTIPAPPPHPQKTSHVAYSLQKELSALRLSLARQQDDKDGADHQVGRFFILNQ